MTAVYWLGAPGIAQLEYPPGSGDLYEIGDLIPAMTEAEAKVMAPLGHNFEIPSVLPYGTIYTEPAVHTPRRVPLQAARTGELMSSLPGVILNGPAPQASWTQSASVASLPTTLLDTPPVAVDEDVLVEDLVEDLVAEDGPIEEVVAVAIPSLEAEPDLVDVADAPDIDAALGFEADAETETEVAPEEAPPVMTLHDVEPLEELPDFGTPETPATPELEAADEPETPTSY